EVAHALGRRLDQRLVDVAQRALRERREGADPLDLVAEELDPQGLAPGGREDVDDASADGELPALLDALDALVACERERLGERVDARLLPARDAERGGPDLRRRHGIGERSRRGAHEAAAVEQLERAGALADEVRRRLEPRAPAHAPRRQERDPVLSDQPGRRLGRVARVGVLGQQDEQRPFELLVEPREQKRQRGLGHARARRQRRREGGQLLQRTQALDEGEGRGPLPGTRPGKGVGPESSPYPGRRRRPPEKPPPHAASEEICTAVPLCGAWKKRPWPTYSPTWPSPLKKTRSPGFSAQRPTPRPRLKSAYELCGRLSPNR